jgi:hypothetical protein
MATYKPDDETAALFARYKRAKEAEELLRPLVKQAAVKDMQEAGATVGALHRLTGMTDEVFRRLARDNDIDRRREPTVGKDAPKRD